MKKDVIVTSLLTCVLKTKRFRDSIAPILRDAGAVSRGRKKGDGRRKFSRTASSWKLSWPFLLPWLTAPRSPRMCRPESHVTNYIYTCMFIICNTLQSIGMEPNYTWKLFVTQFKTTFYQKILFCLPSERVFDHWYHLSYHFIQSGSTTLLISLECFLLFLPHILP